MESEVFAVPDARDSTSLAFSNTSSASEVPRGVVRGSPRPLTMVASPGATSLSFDGPHCSQHGVPRNTQEDYFAHEGGSTVLTADPGEPLESEGTVCGILYKWVNFGKGWRPRWFALKRGILSYHKVNWPNTIPLDIVEHRKPHRIIGDESQRLMKKQRNIHRSIKALGELHLQVSSVRKSNSDDKKFYIFTGTKTLHLRAESREDRSAWLDALFAAKESLPRRCPKQVIVPPLKAVLSTEKLRHRLLEEGLKEGVIDECEETMQGEILKLQKHVRALEQSHYNLIERLKHLEAEKLELETTVMDETQSKLWKDATFGRQGQGAWTVERVIPSAEVALEPFVRRSMPDHLVRDSTTSSLAVKSAAQH